MNQILSALVVLCLSIGVALSDRESDKNEVFARAGYPPMEPSKTLEALRRLSAAYTRTDCKGCSKVKRDVETLISVSEISLNKCTQDTVDQINNLMKIFHKNKVNLVPYLEYSKKNLIDECKNKFGISNLNPETASDDNFMAWSA